RERADGGLRGFDGSTVAGRQRRRRCTRARRTHAAIGGRLGSGLTRRGQDGDNEYGACDGTDQRDTIRGQHLYNTFVAWTSDDAHFSIRGGCRRTAALPLHWSGGSVSRHDHDVPTG